jgi:hypothetical protein
MNFFVFFSASRETVFGQYNRLKAEALMMA